MADLAHAAERKLFETALNALMKKAGSNRGEGYVGVVNALEKVMGDEWKPEVYEKLRTALGQGGKWQKYFDDLFSRLGADYLKGIIMSFGYEGAFSGYRRTRRNSRKLGISIPWAILFDPTSACNLHCIGCWAAEYKKTLNLTYDEMDDLVTQANELGIHEFLMTGGEPMVRRHDILRLAEAHPDNGYMIFTNGTLIDQEFCDGMKKCRNIVPAISVEGLEEATDQRRGSGTFKKIMAAMDLLYKNGLFYGSSVCYTSKNYKAVTSDEFFDFLVSKGVSFSWYFHYMPVGTDAAVDLLPTPEQREYVCRRIRETRGWEGGKPLFLVDFQNDGEFVHGCVAGGKCYCHINANGDVEPCAFVHYSGANIRKMSLLDCLKQPLFRAYQTAQPFNKNYLQPCPMLENPEMLVKIVKESGARSTDMLSPESAEQLCAKCAPYAAAWKPEADRLWKKSHPEA
ncbi:MAG: radical SAM protein [Pyramidobacter sp.]